MFDICMFFTFIFRRTLNQFIYLQEETKETKAQTKRQYVTNILQMCFTPDTDYNTRGPHIYLRNCLRTSFVTGSLSARSLWMLRVSSASRTSSSSSTARQDHISECLLKEAKSTEKGGCTK